MLNYRLSLEVGKLFPYRFIRNELWGLFMAVNGVNKFEWSFIGKSISIVQCFYFVFWLKHTLKLLGIIISQATTSNQVNNIWKTTSDSTRWIISIIVVDYCIKDSGAAEAVFCNEESQSGNNEKPLISYREK